MSEFRFGGSTQVDGNFSVWTSATITSAGVVSASDFRDYNFSGSKALVSDSNKSIVESNVTSTQIGYLSTTSADIQSQLTTLSGSRLFATNGADNRVATFSNSNTLNGESGLTFDGTDLSISTTYSTRLNFNSISGANVGIRLLGDNTNKWFVGTYDNTHEFHVFDYATWNSDIFITSGANGTIRLGSNSTKKVNLPSLSTSAVVVTDGSKNLVSSNITTTKLNYLNGVTSDIQTQLDSKQNNNVYPIANGNVGAGYIKFATIVLTSGWAMYDAVFRWTFDGQSIANESTEKKATVYLSIRRETNNTFQYEFFVNDVGIQNIDEISVRTNDNVTFDCYIQSNYVGYNSYYILTNELSRSYSSLTFSNTVILTSAMPVYSTILKPTQTGLFTTTSADFALNTPRPIFYKSGNNSYLKINGSGGNQDFIKFQDTDNSYRFFGGATEASSTANALIYAGGFYDTSFTNGKVLVSNTNEVTESSITSTELGYLSTTSANIQTQLANLSATDSTKVDKTTQVIAGTGLTGGGVLSANVTVSLPNTGVIGTYTKVSTDAQGRVSAATNITSADVPTLPATKIGTGIINDTEFNYLDGVSANLQTQLTTLSGSKVDKTVQLIAGTGLTGGGVLSANVTVSLPNTGVVGTYTKVSTDAQGRVSAASNITSADVPTLPPSKILEDANDRFVTDIQIGKWDSVYNSVSGTSASWNSVYATVSATSAAWNAASTSAHTHGNKTLLDQINQSVATSATVSFVSISATNISGTTLTIGNVSNTEFGYLNGTSANIQNQLTALSGSRLFATNGADNRVATFSNSNTLNGESGLTFDETELTMTTTNSARINLNTLSGSNVGIRFRDKNVNKWFVGTYDNTHEFHVSDYATWNSDIFITSGANGLVRLGGATKKVNLPSLSTSAVVVTDGSKNLVSSTVSTTELGYVAGTTSNIQTQIDNINLLTLSGYSFNVASNENTGNKWLKIATGTMPDTWTWHNGMFSIDGGYQGRLAATLSWVVHSSSGVALSAMNPLPTLSVIASNGLDYSNFKLIITSDLPLTNKTYEIWYNCPSSYTGLSYSFSNVRIQTGTFTPNSTPSWQASASSGTTYSASYSLYSSTAKIASLNTSAVVVTDGSKKLESSNVSTTELGYLNGTSANIQNQLGALSATKQDTLINPITGTGSAGRLALWNSGSEINSNEGFVFGTQGGVGRFILVGNSNLSGAAALYLKNAAGYDSNFICQDPNGANRWLFGKAASTNNFFINNATSAGSLIDTPLSITDGASGAIILGGSQNNRNVRITSLSTSAVVVTDGSKNLVSSPITTTELNYLDGTSANIQTQFSTLSASSHTHTNKTNLDTINQTLGTGSAVRFDSLEINAADLSAYDSVSPSKRITQTMAGSDQWRIYGEGTVSDDGRMIIETGDNGNEPIHLAFRNGNTRNIAYTFTPTTLSATVVTAIFGGLSASTINVGNVSNTEFNYLDGVTSNIQTQINNKATVSNTVIAATYDSNSNLDYPENNTIYSFVGSKNITSGSPFGNAYYNIIDVRHRNGSGDGLSGYGGQLVWGMTSYGNRMAFRTRGTSAWNSWNEIWTSANLPITASHLTGTTSNVQTQINNILNGTTGKFTSAISIGASIGQTFTITHNLGYLRPVLKLIDEVDDQEILVTPHYISTSQLSFNINSRIARTCTIVIQV